ncbi:hypothetical protein BWQ96_00681 [Gracilariopsis chorda]|uniref:Uncharacterized protein n=1 Tax=Gracilariopsis chorda TaxID=448386 RepID=A0A2V3J5A7_9FLOR|nr:hypothetical protein BWQ96_00681 [Gracilariopsis chorda]|eukprot:PXF49611.1 hypothetical protein BWQ96_00681 [Gracilariopsis chorda]
MREPTRDLDVDLSNEKIRALGILCHIQVDIKLNINLERLKGIVDRVADRAWVKPRYTSEKAIADVATIGIASTARFAARLITRFSLACFARDSEQYKDLRLAINCISMANVGLQNRFEKFSNEHASRGMLQLLKSMGESDELDHEEMRRIAMLT